MDIAANAADVIISHFLFHEMVQGLAVQFAVNALHVLACEKTSAAAVSPSSSAS